MRSLTPLLICLILIPNCFAKSDNHADRPNILWLTSEDNSFQWLGCYGSKDAMTPRLDKLASRSTLFTRAYSNAPVCAVARSTLLMGLYAPSIGTQHQRARYPIPSKIKPYVTYLREAGYYCTNNSKTDYNFKGKDKSFWNECSGKAHYKNRPKGSPFFAVFNNMTSHESSLFVRTVKKNRKNGRIPKEPRLDPAKLELPPYVPNLPEIREDWAIYHDNMTAMDSQMGKLMDELEAAGLAEDTIIFYYGDHGGATPRGKRYLTDTGIRIPLLIHVPEKWEHLTPFKQGEKVDEMVSFVDFAPTLLSLCGLEKPELMVGRPFLGENRVEPAQEQEVYLYADRFDELVGMRRGYSNGKYKYIRRFTPHLPAAAYSYYPFGQPSWKAWQQAWKDGKLTDRHHDIWESYQPIEHLYDTEVDPWEVKNLASDPAYADQLEKMRTRLKELIIEAKDTSLIPEPMYSESGNDNTVFDFVRSDEFDAEEAAEIAFVASARDESNVTKLIAAMQDDSPVIRYWGALGCQILGENANANEALVPLLKDKAPSVRITAAKALVMSGDSAAKDLGTAQLIAELDADINNVAFLLLINTIETSGVTDNISDEWIKNTLKNKKANQNQKRFASRIKKAR